MQRRSLSGLMGILALGGRLVAQQQQPQPKSQGARDLYYFGATQKDELPPIRKVSTPAKGTKPAPTVTQSAGAQPGRAPVTPGAAVEAAGGPRLRVLFPGAFGHSTPRVAGHGVLGR